MQYLVEMRQCLRNSPRLHCLWIARHLGCCSIRANRRVTLHKSRILELVFSQKGATGASRHTDQSRTRASDKTLA